MAKNYFLRFLLRNHADDLIFAIREEESARLDAFLNNNEDEKTEATRFFWFSSLDGHSVLVNLTEIQAVRLLWDPAEYPSDSIRYDGPIRILLRGREEPLEEYTNSPEQLHVLFINFEQGALSVPYPGFDDEDGEPLLLNPKEVVWIIAPTHLLDEGADLIAKEHGFENNA